MGINSKGTSFYTIIYDFELSGNVSLNTYLHSLWKISLLVYFLIFSASIDAFVADFRVQKLSLLREFCKKTGVQILLREYDFDNKKYATFSDEDILNLFPIVKCATPKAVDASVIFEAAQSRLQSGS